jgi:exoribonuclease-2
MILANWLAASFLRDHGQAAVFRSQQPPRQRLITENGGTLFQKWMQRRFLSRVVLGLEPEPHSGLGLDAYLTCTSPLRKYLDLVTQRQMRALLGLEEPYSDKELEFIAQAIKEPLSYIMVLQQERNRYWTLRYLETLVGQEKEALVLERRRRRYILLLTEYMLEASLPIEYQGDLTPQDTVQVKIDKVDARSDTLTVSLV